MPQADSKGKVRLGEAEVRERGSLQEKPSRQESPCVPPPDPGRGAWGAPGTRGSKAFRGAGAVPGCVSSLGLPYERIINLGQ